MDNFTPKVKDALKTIRRAIEDCKDWNEIYGLEGELEELAGQAEDQICNLSDG